MSIATSGAVLAHNGTEATAQQWATRLGMSTASFLARVRKHGPESPKVFAAPPGQQRYTYGRRRLTAEKWAERLGITRAQFMRRLRLHGPRSRKTFAPAAEVDEYTHGSRTMTAPEWAEALGMSEAGFRWRLDRYGPDDERTYMYNDHRYTSALDGVEVAGVGGETVCAVARYDEIDELLAACPELRDCETREDAEVTATVFARWFGPMDQSEVAHVMGISGQRVRQLEERALKKLKLAGGRELRETWEHVSARNTITWSEASDLMAWGLADDGSDE